MNIADYVNELCVKYHTNMHYDVMNAYIKYLDLGYQQKIFKTGNFGVHDDPVIMRYARMKTSKDLENGKYQ